MEVTQEMVLRGRVTLSIQDGETARAVCAYNERLGQLRRQMKLLKELRFAAFLITPLFLPSVLFPCRETAFRSVPMALTVLCVVAAAYILSLVREAPWIHAVANVLLLLLDWRFAILLAVNILLSVWILRLEGPLKREVGYPLFFRIELEFEEPRPDL